MDGAVNESLHARVDARAEIAIPVIIEDDNKKVSRSPAQKAWFADLIF